MVIWFLFQVGFFGNVAFCDTEISGDIINHFKQNSFSDGIKLCFVFSIAVSIPLIVFPCRLSLYNLLFPQVSQVQLSNLGIKDNVSNTIWSKFRESP